jgi:hypothetical protein
MDALQRRHALLRVSRRGPPGYNATKENAMTEQQIIDIMTAGGHPQFDGSLTDLTGLYVSRLAMISDKLSPQELAELISIGVALYQKGFKEFKAGIDTTRRPAG